MVSVRRSCPWAQALLVSGLGCGACDRRSLVATVVDCLFSWLSRDSLRGGGQRKGLLYPLVDRGQFIWFAHQGRFTKSFQLLYRVARTLHGHVAGEVRGSRCLRRWVGSRISSLAGGQNVVEALLDVVV